MVRMSGENKPPSAYKDWKRKLQDTNIVNTLICVGTRLRQLVTLKVL